MRIIIDVPEEGAMIFADDIPCGKHTDGHEMVSSKSSNFRLKSSAAVVIEVKALLENMLSEN